MTFITFVTPNGMIEFSGKTLKDCIAQFNEDHKRAFSEFLSEIEVATGFEFN
jgi:hypothetical protein